MRARAAKDTEWGRSIAKQKGGPGEPSSLPYSLALEESDGPVQGVTS